MISDINVTKASRAGIAMRRVVAATLLVFASLSLATAQVPDCAAGKLSDYEKLGVKGCVIGDKKFSDFRYQSSDGLPSNSISVTPGTVPDSDDPALLIEAAWVAPATHGSSVSYTVEVQPKGKPISGATLEMQLGQISGTGQAEVMAKFCPVADGSGNRGPTELKLDVSLATSGPKKVMDNGELKNPVREVRVVSPLRVAAGKNGTASLNGFMTVFHSGAIESSVPGESSAGSSTRMAANGYHAEASSSTK
jgi:hypothetical protein